MTDAVAKLERLMGQVRSSIDPAVPAQLVQTFLVVAQHEGKSLREIQERLDASMSTVSRHLLDLGERNRKMEPGYGLVDRRPNPVNLRENTYKLTPKGSLLIRQLVQIIEG
jgi:DNA-binding MarR family transcriptional regulator